MIEQWRKQLHTKSGNFTTNDQMPEDLIELLLEEDKTLKERLVFEEICFPQFGNLLDSIPGFNILAGLQRLKKKDCLTIFRAMRFPTYKRIYKSLRKDGYTLSNYEQERILRLYQSRPYIKQRAEIASNHLFWVQPQERVVKGLPVFYLVNDSLQIHRAFRGEADRVAMTVIFIPRHLLFTKKITLIANTGIDVQYDNSDRDYTITDFIKIRGEIRIDLESLRVRGIDLYEMYTPDLPWNIRHAKQLGIEQELFLMDVRNVDTNSKIFRDVFRDTKMLKSHDDFLHGFFGDQNIFGRRPSEYLPKNVYSIKIT